MAGDDLDSGDIDWFDDADDSAEPSMVETRAPSWRWHWWYLVVAGALVAGGLAWRAESGSEHVANPNVSVLPNRSPTPLPAVPVPPVVVSSSAAAMTITQGRPIQADAPTGWELYGRGPNVIVRIQLRDGRITTTTTPALNSSGPVSFIVGAGTALVRPLDNVPGYTLRDSGSPTALPPSLDHGGPALPGPDPGHVWVPTGTGRGTVLQLVGIDGTPTPTLISLPLDVGIVSSDGAGYAVFFGTGGVYDARPDSTVRITTGSLLAVGPATWLTIECDEQYQCTTMVVNRVGGTHRSLSTPVNTYESDSGVISPDGRTAALLQSDANGHDTLHLLNLVTGADRTTGVSMDQDGPPAIGAMVWAPDSTSLFLIDSTGTPLILDPETGHTTTLGTTVPQLTQLAFSDAGAK